MKKVWQFCGRLAFWLTLPIIATYLRGTHRTRVLVVHDKKILVTKAWLGDGRWSLPGGGIHHGESAVAAVMRELREETGLIVSANDFEISRKYEYKSHGFNFDYQLYIVKLDAAGPLQKQLLEITELAWLTTKQLTTKNAAPDVFQGLQAWLG